MQLRTRITDFLLIFLTLATPFLILSLINQLIPVSTELTTYGYIFSFFTSLLLTLNLIEKHINVLFDNRDLFIKDLTARLLELGYAEKNRAGFLRTFESFEPFKLPWSKEILVYIYKDSAVIVAPNRQLRKLHFGHGKEAPESSGRLLNNDGINSFVTHSLSRERPTHLRNHSPLH